MKVIGYGLCGPGEAKRYMRETLDEFKRLCDHVIILCNNCDQEELDLIKEYGFEYRLDRREWGTHQWRIKQDFIERDIKQAAQDGDILLCLDMDEVIPKLTKQWLLESDLDAYHVFVVDVWNDVDHYKPESCFWNVRIWKWNGETKFKAKPVHCGLAPEWAYHYHRHAPFVLIHKGLMAKEDRQRKIARYERYDPHAQHLDRKYYDMLSSDTARPFDFEKISAQIEGEVAAYKQTKPKRKMAKKKERFAYVENPHKQVVDIPERHVERTLKQKGFRLVGWHDDAAAAEVEAMFEDDAEETPTGSYQRPAIDEQRELDTLNQEPNLAAAAFDIASPDEEWLDDHPKPNPNIAKNEPTEKKKPKSHKQAPKKK